MAENRDATPARATETRSRQRKEDEMPLVEVKGIKGVFSDDQKREVIERMTDVLCDVEGEYMRPVTFVLFEEIESGDWGIGGNALSTADVHALKAGA
jgi:4-oxalocrotonate tautomerase